MNQFTLIPFENTAPPVNPFLGRHLIDGEWRDSSDNASFERFSPSHAVLVSRSARGGEAETLAAIAAARRTFDAGGWSQSPGKSRAAILLRAADLIDSNRERIALLEVMESGKPISQARDEIEAAADLWRYAAALARTMHGDSHSSLGADTLAMVLREPVGVAAIITPWNFPFLIVSQKLPFALAAGCTAVVKPSEMTPSTLKKLSLELGGKNPQVVFRDADLDAAADAIAFGIYFNAGECCNSGSRIIVHEDIAAELTTRIAALSRQVAVGDPLNPATKVGAIISDDHLNKIDSYVRAAQSAGARIVLGGGKLTAPDLQGHFYQPTIISEVTPDMTIAREEIFGPVLAILTFRTEEEAIQLANDASFGLSAGVWSRDIHTCLNFVRKIRAGTVWTNSWMDGFAELPFGGFKESGTGRELGRFGIEEFLEVKTVQLRVTRGRNAWVE